MTSEVLFGSPQTLGTLCELYPADILKVSSFWLYLKSLFHGVPKCAPNELPGAAAALQRRCSDFHAVRGDNNGADALNCMSYCRKLSKEHGDESPMSLSFIVSQYRPSKLKNLYFYEKSQKFDFDPP